MLYWAAPNVKHPKFRWVSSGGLLAVLVLGAKLNAELERGRAIEAGHPDHIEPFVEPRDTRKLDDYENRA